MTAHEWDHGTCAVCGCRDHDFDRAAEACAPRVRVVVPSGEYAGAAAIGRIEWIAPGLYDRLLPPESA